MNFNKNKKEIYLDFASATPVSAGVRKAMQRMGNIYANPSSIHGMGVIARKHIDGARKEIADAIGARADEIVFTSSATEANTLAIVGAVAAWEEKNQNSTPHIIVSAIEHPSVLETARVLEKKGVSVTILPVSGSGIVDLDILKKSITPNTALISVMYANNEIGTLQPITEIAKIIRDYKKSIGGRDISCYPLLHTDACQAFQYESVSFIKLHADLLVFNASKIYGPRGIATLAVKKGTPIVPIFVGGEQEFGLRAGTEPTELIVGFAAAVRETISKKEKEALRLTIIRDAVFDYIRKKLPSAIVNGDERERLPNNVSISVSNIDSDYLLLELSARGVYVSSKSACGMENGDTSHVILAIGGDPMAGNLRFSFGRSTKLKDVLFAIDVLSGAIEKWKRFS